MKMEWGISNCSFMSTPHRCQVDLRCIDQDLGAVEVSLVTGGLTSHGSLALAGQKCTSLSRSCCLLSFLVLFGVSRCLKSTFDVCVTMQQ